MGQQIRSSDVFLKEDVAAILRALALTTQAAHDGEFTRGFRAALAAVAVALNIESDRSPAGVVGLE